MWIAKTILALVYATAVCCAWIIQPVVEDSNAEESSIVNDVPVAGLLFGDGDQFISKRMGEVFQASESQQYSRQQQQQQNVNSGINEEFLPFLQALASRSTTETEPVYYQQQQNAVKQDRQGHYNQGAHGYDGLQKQISLGVPSIGIKIDPFGILKALLSLIPRPKLDLSGKLFFGVELGKKAGFGKGPIHPY